MLEKAAEEQELYKKLGQLTQDAFNPDLEKENKQDWKPKKSEVT